MAAVITVAAAIVAATAAYFFRRREHLRERRLDAYQAVLAAFLDAARSAAALLSVHMHVGWPHELNREQWTEEQRSAMAQAHADAWERAATDRHAFEAAAYGVELVASASVKELRAFLASAAYSGSPWNRDDRGDHLYPAAKLNPADIEPKAIEVAGPYVRRAARQLWGRAAPDPHAPDVQTRNGPPTGAERPRA
jgi:hypothetical protein